MKKHLDKYRSIAIIGGSLVFGLVSSLLVYHPDGVIFNRTPLTVIEWICDIITVLGFFFGVLTLMYDSVDYQKKKLKEAILEAREEIETEK